MGPPKLAYLVADGPGTADALLVRIAERLQARGYCLGGAVQTNDCSGPDGRCHMDLHVLPRRRAIRISQDLGPHAAGCTLDPSALETAVGLAQAELDEGADLCIVNKFGKAEAEGRGFCSFIVAALDAEVPLLMAVNGSYVSEFKTFAGDLAERIDPTDESLDAWCDRAL